MLAMIMSQGDNFGGTLATMRFRFLGTLFGAIYSYFVFLAVGSNFYHTIAMFIPFLLLCGVIRQNKQWSYFGSISSTSGLIVTFGLTSYQNAPLGDFALLRIQENAIGVLLCFAISIITVPVFAADLLKLNYAEILKRFHDSNQKVWASFERHMDQGVNKTDSTKSIDDLSTRQVGDYDIESGVDTLNHDIIDEDTELELFESSRRLHNVTYLNTEVAVIRILLAQQPGLIDQASFEMIFSSRGFPVDAYLRIMSVLRLMLDLVFSLDRSLLRISTLTTLSVAKQTKDYASALKPLVENLLNIINDDLNRWSALLASLTILRARAFPYQLRSQEEHLVHMETIHSAAARLHLASVQGIEEIFSAWIMSVVDGEEDNDSSSSRVHRRMGILTSFNTLFYASSSLAKAAIELGNELYLVYETEMHGNFRKF